MNRRVKLKLDRARRSAKKYIFSTRYTVRNTCAILALGTIITGSVFAADKAGDAAKAINAVRVEKAAARAEAKEAAAAAREQEEKEQYSVNLEYNTDSFITEMTVESIKAEITGDEDTAVEMEANDTNDLTQSMYDMTGKFISSTEGLNVRVATDTDAEIVATLGEGASGTVEGTDGEWTKVKSGDVEGYVKSEYIVTDEEASEIAETSTVQIATIKDQQVNVRESASTDSDVIYMAVEGDTFVVNEENSGEEWTNVELADGTFAYVATDYVDIEEGFEEAVSQDDYNLVVDAKKEKAEEEARRAAEAQAAASAAASNTQQAAASTGTTTGTEETTQSSGGNAVESVVTQEAPVASSSDDLYLLAAIVYAESGGESYEGQLAVASVVMNRVRNGYWGSSISSVIYAPGQFAGAYTGAFSSALSTGGSSTSLQAAQDALNGANNVGGCMYFRPTWNIDTSSLGSYIQIGNHIFY